MNQSITYGSISPVTLYQDWLEATRLSILACLSVIGSFVAGCVITAIFVQRRLCRLGNSFLGTVALADILDCAIYMPISMVVILSNQGDNYCTCLVQLFFGRTNITYKYIIFMFITLDDFRRLRKRPGKSSFRHTPCSVLIKILSSLTAALLYSTLSTFGSWGPAFCDRRQRGVQMFQVCTSAVLFLFPTLLNMVFQMFTLVAAHKHFKLPKSRRPPIMNRDWNLALINIGNFFMLFVTTAPSIIVQTFDLKVSDGTFYILYWLTFIFRSSIFNLVYGISNVEFKKGFAYTIKYCFMKSTVVNTGRHTFSGNRRTVGVRFHVMQPVRVVATYEQDSRNTDGCIL